MQCLVESLQLSNPGIMVVVSETGTMPIPDSGNLPYVVMCLDSGESGDNETFVKAEGYCCMYERTTNWKAILVGKFCGKISEAKEAFLGIILKCDGTELLGVSTDTEMIFSEEYGEELRGGIEMIRVRFKVTGIYSPKCENLKICSEDCC